MTRLVSPLQSPTQNRVEKHSENKINKSILSMCMLFWFCWYRRISKKKWKCTRFHHGVSKAEVIYYQATIHTFDSYTIKLFTTLFTVILSSYSHKFQSFQGYTINQHRIIDIRNWFVPKKLCCQPVRRFESYTIKLCFAVSAKILLSSYSHFWELYYQATASTTYTRFECHRVTELFLEHFFTR